MQDLYGERTEYKGEHLLESHAPADPMPPFSSDFAFNGYPLEYERLGPEIRIYQLKGGKC